MDFRSHWSEVIPGGNEGRFCSSLLTTYMYALKHMLVCFKVGNLKREKFNEM